MRRQAERCMHRSVNPHVRVQARAACGPGAELVSSGPRPISNDHPPCTYSSPPPGSSGWDDAAKLPVPGCSETTLSARVPEEDLRDTTTRPVVVSSTTFVPRLPDGRRVGRGDLRVLGVETCAGAGRLGTVAPKPEVVGRARGAVIPVVWGCPGRVKDVARAPRPFRPDCGARLRAQEPGVSVRLSGNSP